MPRNDQRLSSGNQYVRFWNENRLKALNVLRLHGFSYRECGQVFGVSEGAARTAACDYEITSRVPRISHMRKQLEAEVAKRCKEGVTDTQIANELQSLGYEVDTTAVGYIRRKLGIPSGCGWGGQKGSNGPRYKGTNPKV